MRNVEELEKLVNQADRLSNLESEYKNQIRKDSIDKHAFKFGGDSRFAVFATTVFLDCHTGRYGDSNCSVFGGRIDKDIAKKHLNIYLNKHKSEILQEMAATIQAEAGGLISEATEELEAKMQKIKELSK